MECPAESVLIDLVTRTVATEPASALEAHLADCSDCRRLAFALAAERAADPVDVPRHRIGRFEVIALVGAGAMGRVYRARDPGLEREVAIKVRRARLALASDGDERLRREGQALARLSHPHVIAVHETGVDDGASYIVMEYVEGATLDRWVATPRSVAAVIDVLSGVARGLAAAHGAGLVHRDVKPGNILVTPDGAAKIGDFGLARLEIDRAAPAAAPATAELTLTLSMTGSLIGTPAYMAPEQLQGGVASERSDQFGFCVTLFEAVTGRRPFGGQTTTELVAAIARGLRPAALDGLPARLRAVLARGLQFDPARRFPSMTALVDALGPRAARSRWFAVAGAIGLAIAGVLLARSGEPVDRCAVPDGRIPQMFGAPRRVLVTARFAAAGPRGVDEARVANDLLVAYGDRWQAAEATSCRASGGQPSRLRDRQRACLERRLARADDLMALLTQPVANAPVSEAARGIEALGEPAACLRVAAEGAERDPPSAALAPLLAAPLLAAYDRQVGHLVNLVRMRRGAEARDVEGLVAAVRALGEPALLSRALAAQAEVYAQRERFDEIEALLDEAGREGARANDDTLVAEAWTLRVFVLGEHLGRVAEARRWAAAADAAILRAGDPPQLRAQLHQIAGAMYSAAGEYAHAQRETTAALALRERYQPTATLSLAAVHNSLGTVLNRAGQHAAARVEYERALALVRGAHGELHPDVVAFLLNLGSMLSTDDPRSAIGMLEEARRVAVQLSGPTSIRVALILDTEGIARSHLGEHITSAALHRRAYELLRAHSGDQHPRVAYALGNVASEELELGDYAAAVRDARECLRILVARLGPNDTHVALAHGGLGDALLRVGDARGAIAAYRAALAAYETADDHGREDAAIVRVDLGHLLANAGDAAAACSQFARAEPALRHALGENHVYALLALAGLVACDAADRRVDRARLRVLEDAVAAERTLSPEAIGFTAFARARAWAALGDRGQARALAAAARAAFARAGIAERSDVPAGVLGAMR